MNKLIKSMASATLDALPECATSKLLSRDSAWYDNCYDDPSSGHNGKLLTSGYLGLYRQVARMVGYRAVMELGCGTGQFAELCRILGVQYTRGLDFSHTAIKLARERVPQWDWQPGKFQVCDLSSVAIKIFLARRDWECLVCVEVLEHLVGDLELVESLPQGSSLIASVPQFWAASHVRRFKDLAAVSKRYSGLLEFRQVLEVGGGFILFEGVRI